MRFNSFVLHFGVSQKQQEFVNFFNLHCKWENTAWGFFLLGKDKVRKDLQHLPRFLSLSKPQHK